MIAGLVTRGQQLGRTAQRRAIARLAARLRNERPDARVEESVEGLTVTGRGVLRDPRLVWIGSLLK